MGTYLVIRGSADLGPVRGILVYGTTAEDAIKSSARVLGITTDGTVSCVDVSSASMYALDTTVNVAVTKL